MVISYKDSYQDLARRPAEVPSRFAATRHLAGDLYDQNKK
jgi:hypothetical protein